MLSDEFFYQTSNGPRSAASGFGQLVWADPAAAPAMPEATAKAFASPLRLRSQLLYPLLF